MPKPKKTRRTPPRPPTAPPWLTTGQAPAPAYRTYLPIAAGGSRPPVRSQIGPTTGEFARQAPRTQMQGGAYPTYLPTIMRGTEGAPPAPAVPYAGTPSPARLFGRYGYAFGHAPGGGLEPAGPPQQPAAAPPGPGLEAGGGGGGGGGGTRAAPPGVNPGWYAEFQRRHGGQTPEEFYGQTGEGLPEAMADEEWGRGFAEMYGRAPTDDDWRAHWFATRVGYQPRGQMTPRQYDRWLKERKARRRARQEARRNEGKIRKEGDDQRPPVYMPPPIIWR